MHIFPDPRAIDDLLAAAEPLPVLYGHKCGEETHAFHARLTPAFKRHGLLLECDQFPHGVDVQVAMRSLRTLAVVFHADANSIRSDACRVELETAKLIGVPIFVLRDGGSIPSDLEDRISFVLPGRTDISSESLQSLARQVSERARVHWICQWMAEGGRGVEEREGGAAWLGEQPGQVLAEYLPTIVRLHRGRDEDTTVSARLAAVLERTNLRREARIHLRRWYEDVEGALSKITIEDILGGWGMEIR